jgi:hypothetical protein
LPHVVHSPRVTIDRLVVSRERWHLGADDVDLARLKTEGARFLAVRALGRRLGWPRFLFYKVPDEPKPYYLDLDSLVLVEIFAKLCRKGAGVTLTEMLPTVEETWLVDREGNRYTCELRLAALDHRLLAASELEVDSLAAG